MVEFANGVKGMSMHLPNQAGSTLQNLEKRSYVFGVINWFLHFLTTVWNSHLVSFPQGDTQGLDFLLFLIFFWFKATYVVWDLRKNTDGIEFGRLVNDSSNCVITNLYRFVQL